VDLNATDHPLGREGTFSAAEAEPRSNGSCAATTAASVWGGDYRGRKDEMHFEIDRPLAACEKVAGRLMGTRRGNLVLVANPGQARVILS
jgi:hypothetical protein